MSLESLQREQLLEQAIRELLFEGVDPTPELVEERFEQLLEEANLGQPTLTPEKAEPHSHSSAGAYNRNNSEIKKDLDVLYEGMYQLSEIATDSLERWRFEMQKLENQIDALDNRVSSLLSVTRDTEGYLNFLSDNFTDTSKIDLPRSSVVVDLGQNIVTLGATNPGATRLFLNNLKTTDVTFSAVTQKNLQAVTTAPGGELLNAFDDTEKFWQSRVYTSTPGTVLGELRMKISEIPVAISRIVVKLHSSNSSSSTQITPLYSVDNFEFKQLPTPAFSISAIEKATFTFPSIEAKYLKFILSKEGHDAVDGLSYIYEFGAQEISLFSEGFTPGDESTATLISKPLSVRAPDGSLAEFCRATLQACERIPEDTAINFFIAASNDPTDDPEADLNWVAIDPVGREVTINPVAINFADLEEAEFGNTTVGADQVHVSYDPDNDPDTDPEFSNPAADFTLVEFSGGSVGTSSETATGIRYLLPTNSDRVLDFQFSVTAPDAVPMDLASFIVLRNFGLKGNKTLVRGVQSGWGFSEPYYSTVIEVKSKDGQEIDFGDEQIVIDGVGRKGLVPLSQGFHSVLVHKDNWLDIANNITTLTNLKAADLLYPFNHKLLIEGYQYDGGFTEEKVYTGVDLFAEFRMKQVAPYDLLKNVSADDYSKFAFDLDVEDEDESREPSRVILVKTRADIPDFTNERFVLRAKLNTDNLLFKYLWVKIEFKTDSEEEAPALDSYMVKLGR